MRAAALLAPGGAVVVLQAPPRLGQRISRILEEECGAAASLVATLVAAEEDFFSGRSASGAVAGAESWAWDPAELEAAFAGAGFLTKMDQLDEQEDRLLTPREISAWFDPEKSSWGRAAAAALGEADFETARELLAARAEKGPIPWRWTAVLVEARLPAVP
jgi:putative ATPase